MNEILPKLYLGSMFDACSYTTLEELGITHVLSAASSFQIVNRSRFKNYEELGLIDSVEIEIIPVLDLGQDFIEKGREDGGVLVFCAAGASRSASIVASYLMKRFHITSNSAISYLQGIRPVVAPNYGFVAQLLEYEEKILKVKPRETLQKLITESETRIDMLSPSIQSDLEFIKRHINMDEDEDVDVEGSFGLVPDGWRVEDDGVFDDE
eukprot:TRINITY_DN1309_c0_g1_i1.p1 TRINITY_DN1309_c0_g1~~TRINITY_DN1309_c0_g1_i1.p1  ORF type:complete len:210 (-),score=54.93 TRINITY_DN1309_c0_g1_i1:270-899(-)